eukprot:sb/3470162/
MLAIGSIINIHKKKLGFTDQYIPIYAHFKVWQLASAVYLSVAYYFVIFLPWYQGSGEELLPTAAAILTETNSTQILPTDQMVTEASGGGIALWLIIFIFSTLLLAAFAEFEVLVMNEFYQINIPKEDRGAIVGVDEVLTLILLSAQSGLGLFLEEQWLMTEMFILHLTVVTAGLVLSVWYLIVDDKRVKGYKLHRGEESPLREESPLMTID